MVERKTADGHYRHIVAGEEVEDSCLGLGAMLGKAGEDRTGEEESQEKWEAVGMMIVLVPVSLTYTILEIIVDATWRRICPTFWSPARRCYSYWSVLRSLPIHQTSGN